ncbi:hypothetical protein LC612_40105 [Nostoc sp. CHAB 5834]|nr:hypothetical protein [Nostoc sp. CHAB 5834]
MTRVLPKIVIPRTAKPEPEPFEAVTHAGPVELLFAILISLIFVACLALGAPEPVDCGVDRDAPTLEKGCGDEL